MCVCVCVCVISKYIWLTTIQNELELIFIAHI